MDEKYLFVIAVAFCVYSLIAMTIQHIRVRRTKIARDIKLNTVKFAALIVGWAIILIFFYNSIFK